MTAFYRRLRDGAPASEALRDAQLSLLQRQPYRDPSFWAAFTLTGDPQGRW
jgi:CHAT domain-containing protein